MLQNAPPIKKHPDIAHILLTPQEIARRVDQLGGSISRDYADKKPILIGILKGVFPFLADLSRAIPIPHTIDFMAIRPFEGHGAGGAVQILKDLEETATDRHILLIEDIIDTGLTLHFLTNWVREQRPASLAVCTLLDRPHRRLVELPVLYRGFKVPDHFIVGYGLDYKQQYRHLPYVGILAPAVYLPN